MMFKRIIGLGITLGFLGLIFQNSLNADNKEALQAEISKIQRGLVTGYYITGEGKLRRIAGKLRDFVGTRGMDPENNRVYGLFTQEEILEILKLGFQIELAPEVEQKEIERLQQSLQRQR